MRDWKKISFKTLEKDKELLTEFYADYKTTFGKVCMSCESKLKGYYQNLINKPNIMATKKTVCKMKPGYHLIDPASGQVLSAEKGNMSDAAATALIALNPAIASRFEVLPPAQPTRKVAKPKAPKKKKEEEKDDKK